jgi:hypothetical protein
VLRKLLSQYIGLNHSHIFIVESWCHSLGYQSKVPIFQNAGFPCVSRDCELKSTLFDVVGKEVLLQSSVLGVEDEVSEGASPMVEMDDVRLVHVPGCEWGFFGDHVVDHSHCMSVVVNEGRTVCLPEESTFDMWR